MGDSLTDAVKLLRSMGPIFDPTEDYLTIVGADEQMGTVAMQRHKELEDVNSELKTLLRTLDTGRTSCTRPPTVPSQEAHVQTLNSLDAARLNLIKSINDAEGSLAGKEDALARLKEECTKLEASDPATEHELDATTLKLTFIRGLGFNPVSDKKGRVQKMLVSSQSGEVYTVPFTDGRSNDEYANELWKLSSS